MNVHELVKWNLWSFALTYALTLVASVTDSVAVNSSLRRLSAEELEKRRKEMIGFAREREEERVGNVQRYKRQDEQEKERDNKTKQGSQATFIQ